MSTLFSLLRSTLIDRPSANRKDTATIHCRPYKLPCRTTSTRVRSLILLPLQRAYHFLSSSPIAALGTMDCLQSAPVLIKTDAGHYEPAT